MNRESFAGFLRQVVTRKNKVGVAPRDANISIAALIVLWNFLFMRFLTQLTDFGTSAQLHEAS